MPASASGCEEMVRFVSDRSNLPLPTGMTTPRRCHKASSDWQPVTVLFRDLRQDGWGVTLPFTQDALSGFTIESLTTLGYAPIPVSGLYEGMITPLLPSAFRGVLWYQGESNALKAHQYRKLLPALINGWRDALHQT